MTDSIELPFIPFPLLGNCHAQTLVGRYLPQGTPPTSRTHLVTLEDNEQLAVEVSTPPTWNRTAFLVHGLGGDHTSPYLVRIARRLFEQRVRVVRINLRGCGSGFHLANKPYHAGRSEDVLTVINALQEDRPATLVGYSLGGNIGLKLAGELGAQASFDHVIAICPPIDLEVCCRKIDTEAPFFYRKYFMKGFKQAVDRKRHVLSDRLVEKLISLHTIIDFDDHYTAPLSGFKDAQDYYSQCSAQSFLSDIKVKTTILYTLDDPFIDPDLFTSLITPPNVQLYHTKKGGHIGHVGREVLRWLDEQVERWVLSEESK